MGTVELFAVGDVYLDRPTGVPQWDDLAPEMARADLTLCNYEAPIFDRGAVVRGRLVPLRTRAALAGAIAEGWGAVSLAQNHVLDYGEVAALDTLELCAAHGLASAGLGHDIDEAWRPVRLEVGGVALSMLSIACAFPRSFAATTTGMAALLDYQVELGRALADAGAAAVLGTHAHVLQAVEVHGSTPILYGMSHVVFDVHRRLAQLSAGFGTRLVWDPDRAETTVVLP